MTIRNVARGLLASILVLAVFGIVDDFVRTLAGDLIDNENIQYAFRAAVISFGTAFVGAFVARERVELIAVTLATLYWLIVAVTRYLTGVSVTEIGFFEFVAGGLRSIVPSIVFSWLGAIAGRKYYAGAENSSLLPSQKSRFPSVIVAASLILVLAPLVYSCYWKSQAVNQVRIAVRAIQSGETPKNVHPFEDVLIDLTPHIENLLLELTPSTQFRPDYKIGDGFHSYQVEILPGSGSRYTAIATHDDWRGWTISCCWKED